LQSALADLAQNDGLIVAKADRLGRNTKDILTLIDDHIAPAKKDLILINMGMDTATPQGRLMLTVASSFAEFERAMINERTDKGRKMRMRDGKPMGAPKFGEMVKDIDKTRPANESEQKIIQIMIRHRKAGKGYQAIANLLNKKGYPTKQGKTWYYPTVKNILDRAGIP
jgi:DNA invertase Pin-like site-specific DNA recombinase